MNKIKEIKGEYQSILNKNYPYVGFMIKTEHYKTLLSHIRELEAQLKKENKDG